MNALSLDLPTSHGAWPNRAEPREAASFAAKLCERDKLSARAGALERPLVFTNGVFDLLHRGHVEYLDASRRLGASLVVGVNSDRSARKLGKGEDRPLNGEVDRCQVVAALAAVDLVVVFDEPTPRALLDVLRPEFYAKGGDYRIENLPETRQVARWGGRTVILPYRAGHSTTALLRRIRTLALP
jgi:rfaE bifunctional protein nucleotidyltransferase chain/domain